MTKKRSFLNIPGPVCDDCKRLAYYEGRIPRGVTPPPRDKCYGCGAPIPQPQGESK